MCLILEHYNQIRLTKELRYQALVLDLIVLGKTENYYHADATKY